MSAAMRSDRRAHPDFGSAGGATGSLISAQNVFVDAGAVQGLTGNLSARDDIDVNAENEVVLGSLFAGDDINVRGASVSIRRALTDGSGTPDGEEGPGSNLVVDAVGAIQVTSANVATDIRLTSQSGTITGSGTLAAGRDFTRRRPAA
jgi:hypothetical protein